MKALFIVVAVVLMGLAAAQLEFNADFELRHPFMSGVRCHNDFSSLLPFHPFRAPNDYNIIRILVNSPSLGPYGRL